MIKQLIFLMGWETFCKGLQIYFKKFAWSNTELGDFIASMQQGFDENRINEEQLNLGNWSSKWL
jgi:aminopeptidase N